jgi:hypothetical protein
MESLELLGQSTECRRSRVTPYPAKREMSMKRPALKRESGALHLSFYVLLNSLQSRYIFASNPNDTSPPRIGERTKS